MRLFGSKPFPTNGRLVEPSGFLGEKIEHGNDTFPLYFLTFPREQRVERPTDIWNGLDGSPDGCALGICACCCVA